MLATVDDRYLLDALLGVDRQIRVTDHPKLLSESRTRDPTGFALRTVEKAYHPGYGCNDL